ncbi:MAG: hypothetical protein LBG52_06045 [Candidatus Peribacteria bacterium]|nr:hypothetical protein [Candidatus Peribacteria bacterium]
MLFIFLPMITMSNLDIPDIQLDDALKTTETEQQKKDEQNKELTTTKQKTEKIKTELETQKANIENEAWLSFSQGLGLQPTGETFSATRLQGGGQFFKGGKLQTDIYAQLDLVNGKQPGGFLRANKAVYKGVNLDAIYQFTSNTNEKVRLGLTYRGRTENGGYAFGAFPLTQE